MWQCVLLVFATTFFFHPVPTVVRSTFCTGRLVVLYKGGVVSPNSQPLLAPYNLKQFDACSLRHYVAVWHRHNIFSPTSRHCCVLPRNTAYHQYFLVETETVFVMYIGVYACRQVAMHRADYIYLAFIINKYYLH